MMLKGMKVDREYVIKESEKLRRFSENARKWLKENYDITSPLASRQIAKAMNKVGCYILDEIRTPTGLPKADKATLELIINSVDNEAAKSIAKYLLAIRHAEKLAGSYLDNFLTIMDEDDVIHPSINPLAARTSRMSVSEPALQQLPRDDKAIRGSFVPREGYAFISIDADQVEARLSAHLSNDQGMIQAFHDADNGGMDFFSAVASEIFGEVIQKSDTRRQLTKGVVYGLGSIYGAGAEKMAITAGVPVEVMRPVKDGFNARFPGLTQYMGMITRQAREQAAAGERPYVRTPMGRYLPGEPDAGYKLVNYSVQGMAAEILKKGILDLDAAGLGDFCLLPIHDEILMEVPQESADEILKVATEILTNRTDYAVPITWAGKVMHERWSK